jgi:hypothetical protein
MDNFRDPGQLLIREKSIPSPTARAKNRGRAKRDADDNDLRFFDNIEGGRSLSRDRSIRTSEPKTKQTPGNSLKKSETVIDPEIYKSETSKRTLVPDYYLQHPTQTAISLKGAPVLKAPNKEVSLSGMSAEVHYGPVKISKCVHFSKGNCRNGNECRYQHLDGPCLDRVTNNNDQK